MESTAIKDTIECKIKTTVSGDVPTVPFGGIGISEETVEATLKALSRYSDVFRTSHNSNGHHDGSKVSSVWTTEKGSLLLEC